MPEPEREENAVRITNFRARFTHIRFPHTAYTLQIKKSTAVTHLSAGAHFKCAFFVFLDARKVQETEITCWPCSV